MKLVPSRIVIHNKPVSRRAKLRVSHKLRKNIDLTILVLPAFFVIFMFQFVPMPGIIMAFKNYNFKDGIFGSPWAGLANFKFLFSTQDALLALKNTVMYNFIFMITTIGGSVILAILLNEILSKGFLKFYQTSIFLPYFLSWTIVSYIVFSLFDNSKGLINSILSSVGLAEVQWYFEPGYWLSIHSIVHFWKHMGYTILLIYAYVISIDPTYYDAAAVDGATRFQMARKITIPFLTPIIIITFLGALGRIFNADFGQFLLIPLESPMLNDVSSVLDTYVYKALRGFADLGLGAAAGMFQSIAGFVLVMGVNIFIRRNFGRDRAMF